MFFPRIYVGQFLAVFMASGEENAQHEVDKRTGSASKE